MCRCMSCGLCSVYYSTEKYKFSFQNKKSVFFFRFQAQYFFFHQASCSPLSVTWIIVFNIHSQSTSLKNMKAALKQQSLIKKSHFWRDFCSFFVFEAISRVTFNCSCNICILSCNIFICSFNKSSKYCEI